MADIKKARKADKIKCQGCPGKYMSLNGKYASCVVPKCIRDEVPEPVAVAA